MRKLVKRYPRVPARKAERRDRVSYEQYQYNGGTGTYSPLGTIQNVPPDAQSALTIAAVYQAICIYANALGNFDFYVAEKWGGGHRQAVDHWVYDLVHIAPNPRLTAFYYRQTAMVQVLTRGNHYAEIERDGNRKAVAIWPMCPVTTEPVLKPTGELVYRTPAAGIPGHYVELPARDVIHIKTPSYDNVKGLSPVQLMRRTLGLAVSQETHASSTMDNQAVPAGYIKVPGSSRDDAKAMRNRADWQKLHGGPENAGKVAFLYGGMDFVQTQFSPADAELIKSREFSISDVARMYNIPPHKLGIVDSTIAPNIEEANRDFFISSLSPWITQWEQELTSKLLSRVDRAIYFVKNDVGSLLRGNVAAQTAQDASDLDHGVKSINEVRVGRGISPVDVAGADYHRVPDNNMKAIELPAEVVPVAVLDPDDESDQDPTLKALPDLNADRKALPQYASAVPPAALRGVVADPFGRLLHRECQALRKASKRDGFDAWQDTYYAEFASLVAETITPALSALSSLRGEEISPVAVADRFVAESREALRGLVVSTPPDELPAAVGRLCAGWQESRVASVVDGLMGVVS